MNIYSHTCAARKAADYFDTASGIVRRFASLLRRMYRESCLSVHLAGKFRRFFLVHRRKPYVQRQMMYREGECNHCGVCCHLLFTCPAATRNGECLVHGVCRPQVCRIFPIDQRDLDEVRMRGGQCGYSFCRSAGLDAIPVIELNEKP